MGKYFLCFLLLLFCVSCALDQTVSQTIDEQVFPVLWNDDCPNAHGLNPEEKLRFQERLFESRQYFMRQLEWNGGKVCKDPNEGILEEIRLSKKALSEILQTQLIPGGSFDDKILFRSGVEFPDRKRDVLVFRYQKGVYIVKVMKTLGCEGDMFITLRPIDRHLLDVATMIRELFNERMWPPVWESPYFVPKLLGEKQGVVSGCWLTRDMWMINEAGEIVRNPDELVTRSGFGAVGKGIYENVMFCTDGNFISFRVVASQSRK